ncbi:hypothetical protein PMAYCL1PPCAC_19963 [Pristionchus mayeri]|uniref:Uncharacterized protein n=1 Tax=Pristionchus mayeri TaxID=1317129 RepID=A0AAN5I2Q7_9BILA|nr:hypothetical protein PMAYCL1PPCAC_19963 [Pristionchus mayeri]
MRGLIGREDNSVVKDPIRLWIEKGLEVENLWSWEKPILLDTGDFTQLLPNNGWNIALTLSRCAIVRHWFAGTAPLLPITEPSTSRPGLSTVLTRVLIAAVVEKDAAASEALLERAHELCASALHEKSAPFDVVELANVLSEDDDELIVALDAILRLADGIRSGSPLHPLRLVLQVLTANAFKEGALKDLLFDDESGARAAFPMVGRLYTWAREHRVALRDAARRWRSCHLAAGHWRLIEDEDVDEEEEEEDDDEEEEEDGESGRRMDHGSPSEELDDEEMEEGPEPEPEDEKEKENGSSREEVDDSAHFVIQVVQMAGQMEEQKMFLLLAKEEPRHLFRPTRLESEEGADVWPQLLQMSRRLSLALQRYAKRRESNLRKECRGLIEIINRFLEEAEGGGDE